MKQIVDRTWRAIDMLFDRSDISFSYRMIVIANILWPTPYK